MFIEKILDKLGRFYEDEAKKAHGNTPGISWGLLISRIIEDAGASPAYSLFPEISVQTFNRLTKRCFPNIKLNGGNQTWYFYLLSLIEHKQCNGCSRVLEFSSYHKDRLNSSIGLCSICKECVSKEQAGGYMRYNEAHKRSYEKHAAEIKARRALYDGQRALRVPSWYETQRKEIEAFYANCPEGYHVDHIIPLKGKLISGLHVIQNLQYLTAKENLEKGNKYIS